MNQELRESILKLLEKNSRLDLKELAVLLDSTEVDIANEIAEMEKEHIICGYHTLINWDHTSREQLTAMIEVKALYLMSGAYDFMVMLEGKTMKEISMFTSSKLAPLEAVLSTATHFVLKKYKDHGTVLEAKKADKRQAVTP